MKHFCIVCGREIKGALMWPAMIRDDDGTWHMVYAHVLCGMKLEARADELEKARKPPELTGA